MRIESISQPADAVPDGLSEINMYGLRKIVILAGANGSGKSRLLKRVQRASEPGASLDVKNGFKFDQQASRPPASFAPGSLSLADPNKMTLADLIDNAKRAREPGSTHLADATAAYIQRLQNHWWNATHPHATKDTEDFANALIRYPDLRTIIHTFLGEDLERNVDGSAELYSKPITQAGLSAGQTALLQWAVALHAQGGTLADLLLLLDEPENHLHPEALIGAVERILSAAPEGQIWIATHSLSLVASLYAAHDSETSLYFLSGGSAKYASECPDSVVKSLLGGADNIDSLRSFIGLPEALASNRFAQQCLTSPEVVGPTPLSDPQTRLFWDHVREQKGQLSVLDFGCGKGRLLDALYGSLRTGLPDRISYVGWEGSEVHKAHCEATIELAYSDGVRRWFSSTGDLFKHHDEHSFDRVVMTNVLHEISPKSWEEVFSSKGVIRRSLKPDGYLVIIEDYLMPTGECAHPYGFIVLDSEALCSLFNVGIESIVVCSPKERGGRIKGHFVPSHYLANVSRESILRAIDVTHRNARGEIDKLRANPQPDFKAGRAHGYWIQQYANTSLFLEASEPTSVLRETN